MNTDGHGWVRASSGPLSVFIRVYPWLVSSVVKHTGGRPADRTCHRRAPARDVAPRHAIVARVVLCARGVPALPRALRADRGDRAGRGAAVPSARAGEEAHGAARDLLLVEPGVPESWILRALFFIMPILGL